ncbi:D-aminoacyl-tRNA deacylase [Peribacillus huizhouensis]|uniref:D-aminoacyl-tRNA deacylase n=1 Tax=Peribacillus huizhouensis TaxID=1501239 RepID=A0ABR6CL77_9BACI|nr:D-aminoacyl-tRNA deacylase [Peribacillus huizhouensis]MBA9025691.1 D-tyrosyl-tRNA(Tyr) deacylase [Peribacillus huizhouensis]
MRVVVQRSKAARVLVNHETIGSIDHGLVLLVGVTHGDTAEDAAYLAEKITNLRIFEDENEKMNHSLLDVGGSILSISQFTLYGDCKKGRRPNFMDAARPEEANAIYELFNEEFRKRNIRIETGQFGANMQVELTNDGPVTLIVESK